MKNTFDITAEFMVSNIIARLKNRAIRQENDQVRQAYIATSRQISAEVKKMSTTAAIKKAAAIGVVTSDRDEAIWSIYDYKMAAIFGDYEMEPSAKAELIGFENVVFQEVQSGRFTAEQIKDIRISRLMGKSYAQIKKDGNYSVSKDMIRSICIGECYKDVAVAYIETK